MRVSVKIIGLTVITIFALSALVGSAQAAGEEPSGFVKFWRGLFGLPVNTAKESADVVIDTTKKGVEVVGQEGKDVAGTITGSGDSAKDLITNPVTGTVDTVKTAVVGTAEMPEKATDESWPSESSESCNR